MSTLPASWFGWADLITWIPADKKALRRRGFDHMEHIASELARATGIPARKLLVKKASRDQRSLNLSQRKSNLAGSFTPAISDGLLPPHVLLVDDVFTTGATLDAAASALREGGTHEVRAACIARAW
jgi:predicted amidophosphoribosyltransferase